jgi:hypothetical protein
MCFLYLDALSDDHEALKQASLAGARSSAAIRMIRGQDTIRVDDICEALGVPGRARPRQDIAKVIRQLGKNPVTVHSIQYPPRPCASRSWN